MKTNFRIWLVVGLAAFSAACAYAQFTESTDEDGIITTIMTDADGNVQSTASTAPDGSSQCTYSTDRGYVLVEMYADGTSESYWPDGDKMVRFRDGTIQTIDKGIGTEIRHPDGSITKFAPDGTEI